MAGKHEQPRTLGELVALHEQHGSWLLRIVRARFGSQDCEDIVQETWLRMTSQSSVQTISHPRAYLLRVATNFALDKAARQRLSEAIAAKSSRVDVLQPVQDEALHVKEIILSLPPSLRDVFVLSRFGGLTNSQIAEQLGIRPKTVEWRMTKALAHCAAQLRR